MRKQHDGENNPFFGRRHTEETRRKMSEVAKRRWERNRGGSIVNCYRLLIAAVIRRAVKDGAYWFLETEQGQYYCAAVGINPAKCQGGSA